jgi:hypothetical protein
MQIPANQSVTPSNEKCYYLVNVLSKGNRVRDGIRDFSGHVLLLGNVVHHVVHLVDVPATTKISSKPLLTPAKSGLTCAGGHSSGLQQRSSWTGGRPCWCWRLPGPLAASRWSRGCHRSAAAASRSASFSSAPGWRLQWKIRMISVTVPKV